MDASRPRTAARHPRLARAAGLTLLALAPVQTFAATWIGGNGSWTTAANWLGGSYPHSAVESVYIDDGNAVSSVVALSSNSAITIGRLYVDAGDTLSISGNALGPGALQVQGGELVNHGDLIIRSGSALSFAGGQIVNHGVLTLASDKDVGNNNTLALAGDTTLSGSGSTVLVHATSRYGVINAGSATLTIAADHRVTGAGAINGSVVNQGLVVADGSAGLVLAPGSGRSFDNSVGLVQITDGSVLGLGTGTLSGGTIQALGPAGLSGGGSTSLVRDLALAGSLVFSGSATFSGVSIADSLSVATGASLSASGTLVNNGMLTLLSDGHGGSSLALAADTTLSGGGRTLLTSTQGFGGRIHAGAYTLTVAGGHTVGGGGTVVGAVVNQGRFDIDAGRTLSLEPGSSKAFDNGAGLIQLANGAALALGAGSLHGGQVQSSGNARLSSADASSLFDGVSLSGGFTIAGNTAVHVAHHLSLDGQLTLANDSVGSSSALVLAADTLLDGDGLVVLTNNNGRIGTLNANGHVLTLGADIAISGVGLLSGSIVNHGSLAPGLGIGRLSAGGPLSLAGDSRLLIDIAGLTPTTQYDLLAVAGDVALGGSVIFDFGSFAPQVGDSFSFLSFSGNRSGSFDQVQASGYRVGLSYGPHDVSATVLGITPVPEPQPWALLAAGLAALGLLARRRQASI